MTISGTEYQQRRAALQQRLVANGLDAAVLTDEANLAYFAGYSAEFFFLSRSRTVALLIPARGEPAAVVPSSHARDLTEQTGLPAVGYSSLRHAPIDEIGTVLETWEAGDIGLELGFEQRINMTVADLDLLRRRIRGVISDLSAAVWALRMAKSAAELALMEQACRIADAAWGQCLPTIRAGDTEREVAGRFAAEVALRGGRVPFVLMTSGRGNYHRSTGAPRDRALAPGDFVFADLGVRYAGYYSDFNRNFVLGWPAAEQVRLQALVKEISEHAARYLVPGVTAAEVYVRVLDDCRAAGLDIHSPGRIGHGLGLDASEPPHISAEDSTVLVEGLVTTIEPMVERPDALYCAEIVYAVGPDGGRRLNAAGSDLAVADAAASGG